MSSSEFLFHLFLVESRLGIIRTLVRFLGRIRLYGLHGVDLELGECDRSSPAAERKRVSLRIDFQVAIAVDR